MWRLLLVAAAIGLGLAACGDELTVEEDFVRMMEKTREGTFTVTFDATGPDGSREPVTWYRMGEYDRIDTSGDLGRRMLLDGPEGGLLLFRLSE